MTQHDHALVDRYAAPVPRYTSYPTSPHFHSGVNAEMYRRWLRQLPPAATISLYLHIPYCDRLCWFCGCHTKHTLRYEPVSDYLDALFAEIDWVSTALEGRGIVTAIHLGGGSPTLLTPADFQLLRNRLEGAFTVRTDVRVSIEIDPNDLDDGRYDAMVEFGLTRASIGVQDFDPKVQKAINRVQSFKQTKAVIDAMRVRGVDSVNLDLLYGLPFQDEKSIAKTITATRSLQPDRVALFGYAHVPWMKPHQRMIPESALPDIHARFRQARLASEMLTEAGMKAVGFDHFAKPADSLAQAARAGTLRRNFQGYTEDGADALIGLGASAIGQLPQGYVQNIVDIGNYKRATKDGSGAIAKGFTLSPEDKLRAQVISALLCRFSLAGKDVAGFGEAGQSLMREAEALVITDRDGLIEMRDGVLLVTDRGRPFVRSIAANFDKYLGVGTARHSAAV